MHEQRGSDPPSVRLAEATVDHPRWGTLVLRWREGGAGPPILVLPCFPLDGRLFEAQVTAAAEGRIGARVLAIDPPGFGRTPPITESGPLAVDDLAQLLIALGRTLELDRPIFGGVATGASAALEAAALAPDLTGGLVLISSRASADTLAQREARRRLAERVEREGLGILIAERPGRMLAPGAEPGLVVRVRTMIADARPEAATALLHGMADRPDPGPSLDRVVVPTLVIGGAEDPASPPAEVEALAARLAPRAPVSLLVVPGSGHLSPLEQPEVVVQALAALCARIARAATLVRGAPGPT